MRSLLLIVLLTCPALAGAEPILFDAINAHDETDGLGGFSQRSIGWVYTPASDVDLTGIETFSNDWGEGRGTRNVLIEVWTDLPRNGGALLGGGTFDYAPDVWSGTTLAAPIHLTGGQSYIIGIDGLSFASGNNAHVGPLEYLPYFRNYKDPEPGTTFFGADQPGQTTAPRFRLYSVPEPGTVLLMGLAGSVLALTRARKMHRSGIHRE